MILSPLNRPFPKIDLHLGLNLGHDRSAAIVSGGKLLVAVEEERLDRCKHSPGLSRVEGGVECALPWKSILYCLETVGADLSDLTSVTANSPGRDIGPELTAQGFSQARILQIPSHHLAHAYTAWWPSGMDEALVLVVDATGSTDSEGKTESYTLYRGGPDGLEALHSERVDSHLAGMMTLGMVYEEVTRRIGFVTSFEGGFSQAEAGKTMGLAPYGGQAKNLRRWIETQPGSYSLKIHAYDALLEIEALQKRHEKVDGPLWMRPHLVELAAKIQSELEEALIHLVGEAQRETSLNKLCLAGGVALNSVANHRLVRTLGLEGFFAFPAAGDSGIAAGCAWWASHQHGEGPARRERLRGAGLGKPASEAEIEMALSEVANQVKVERLGNAQVLQRSAEALSTGRVLARYEGGCEYGPRALGQRSIIADPTFERMRDVLNARVKHRESYRPFAPVIPLEAAEDVFELGVDSPHMLLVAPVREDLRAILPSITHHDGTGRVQTVTATDNPFFHGLCKQLAKLRGGPPVLLNTSYNVAGEPIVETPADALRTFLATDIDHLALEGWWISKRGEVGREYKDHIQGLDDAPHPQGLTADEPVLDDLMSELDAAIFGGQTSQSWSTEEVDEISARVARYKETSETLDASLYGGPVQSRLADGRLLLVDPRNGSEVIDTKRREVRAVTEQEVSRLLRTPSTGPAPAPQPDALPSTPVGSALADYADGGYRCGSELAELAQRLRAAEYNQERVRAALGKAVVDLAPTDLPYLDRFGLAHDDLGDLIRLFLLRGVLPESRLRNLLGDASADLLVSMGLVRASNGDCVSRVDLFPLDGLLIATDHRYQVKDSDELDEEPVMYLGRDSVGLVQVAPRKPSRRHLDLCTGSGIQALVARRYADEVVGIDRNPRALRFARFNAELNGLDGVSFRLGDLYQPVESEQFETITANPPFVPSPVESLAFRDGGADGEKILRRIVTGAAQHLTEGGRLSIVTDLVDIDTYEAKLASWWTGADYLALMLTTADRDEQLFSTPHSHAPFGQSFEEFTEELGQWVESYRAAGLGAVNFGYLVLEGQHMPSGSRFVRRVIQSPVNPVHAHVEALVDALYRETKGTLGHQPMACTTGLRIQREYDAQGRELSCSASIPDSEWFTTYRLQPSLRALLQEAASGLLTWSELVEHCGASAAGLLLEKGLLVCATPRDQMPDLEPHSARDENPAATQSRVLLLDELASKTTPTCVSNYLR
ncbi:MAG TPA: methyltransferase domain-containing protein [Planctomycetes bacterium]|nr:methyltransferase domain-containing protein [Planctomycetota bacterium]HIK61776.1 methyltransferase domain-containing protein [Planctomycetota bacterium]